MASELGNIINKIQNNSTLDPVREAILKVQENVDSTGAGVGAGILTIDTDNALTGGSVDFSANQSGNDSITIGLANTIPGDRTFSGNIVVSGNFTVNGTTTYLNTQQVEVEDNIIELNRTQGTPDTATASTSGIQIYRGDGVSVASLIFDDADDTWDFTHNVKIAGDFEVEGTISGSIEEARTVRITVKNTESVTLAKGTVVHVHPSATPPSGNVVEVKKADYDTASLMPAIGILNEALAAAGSAGDEGKATMFGYLSGIDTSSFSAGDELYVGNDGALTNTKPTGASQLIQKIAVVIKSDANNGSIEIFGAGRSNDVPNLNVTNASVSGNTLTINRANASDVTYAPSFLPLTGGSLSGALELEATAPTTNDTSNATPNLTFTAKAKQSDGTAVTDSVNIYADYYSIANRFTRLYIDDNVNIQGTLLMNNDILVPSGVNIDIGSNSNRINHIYTDDLTIGSTLTAPSLNVSGSYKMDNTDIINSSRDFLGRFVTSIAPLGAVINLRRDDNSIVADDDLGQLVFYGQRTDGNYHSAGRIKMIADDTWDATFNQESRLEFWTHNTTTEVQRLIISTETFDIRNSGLSIAGTERIEIDGDATLKNVTANSFIGDGSQLTNLTTPNLQDVTDESAVTTRTIQAGGLKTDLIQSASQASESFIDLDDDNFVNGATNVLNISSKSHMVFVNDTNSNGTTEHFGFYTQGTTDQNATKLFEIIQDGNVNVVTGNLKVGGTTVIDSSRNITAPTATIGGILLQDSADRAGLLEVNRKGTNDWSGIQVNYGDNHWSFMGNTNYAGLYDDKNSKWAWLYATNNDLKLYYNGVEQARTQNGYFLATNEFRSAVFRGTNTAYHVTPAGTSNLNGLTLGGTLTLGSLTNDFTSTTALVNSGSGVVGQRSLGSAAFSNTSAFAPASHNHDDRYYTESEIQQFFDRGYLNSHGASNLAVGWYTIATNTGDRALGEFQIWDTASSDHQSVLFNASHHFGNDSSNDITVLANSRFSGTNFRYIRIKDGGTYDGAALQVYIDGSSNSVYAAIVGGNAQSSGWVLKDWIPDATDPGDLSNYSSFGVRCQVDLDLVINGGIITTGEIYSGGETSQFRVLNTGDEGSGNGLDADTVDGLQASQFLRSDTSDTMSGTLTVTGDLNVNGSSGGVLVDSAGHASLRIDRGSTSYDNNLLFYTAGVLRWRLWQDGSSDYLHIRDEANSNNLVNFSANTVQVNGDIYGKSVNNQYSRLFRFGGIYFTWDSDSYGTNFDHSITSTSNGSWSDNITINSYGNVRINIDSNGNGTNTFSIGRHSTGTGNTMLTLNESSELTVNGNIRTPIFYDSDNTNYYLNPASTSIINILRVGTTDGVVRMQDYSNGLSGAGELELRANGGTGWASGDTMGRIRFYLNDGSGVGVRDVARIEAVSEDGNGSTTTTPSGALSFYISQNNSQVNEGMRLSSDNYLIVYGSARSPIFYDSNNTSYYINPDGESRISSIWARGSATNSAPRWDTSFHVVQSQHWYGHSNSQTMYAGESGNDVLFRGQVAIGGTAIQSGYALTMSGHVDMNAYDINYVSQLHFNDNVRFYDAGNDSYLYFKFGDSNEGAIRFFDGGGASRGWLYTDTSGFGLLSADGSWGLRVTDSLVESYHQHRAPIYYDSDNTAYYLNAASTSRLNQTDINYCDIVANAAYALRFWGGSHNYSIRMSQSSNSTYGGRVAGETTSDYNMYFTMAAGTNRGFVFRSSNSASSCVAGIDASGTIRTISDVIAYASSDKRLKDNITPIDNAIDKVQKISGVTFDWNDKQDTYEHGKHDVGVIAQEIEEVLPEVVDTRENGYKAVKYEKIVPLLIEAIKEQQKQIDELKSLINKS